RERPQTEQFAMLQSIASEEVRKETMAEFFSSWSEAEPMTAFAAANSLPAGPERIRMTGEVLIKLAAKDTGEAFRQSERLGFLDPDFRSLLVNSAASNEAALTAHWLEKAGDNEVMKRCGPRIVGSWIYDDLVGAFSWAGMRGISLTDAMSDDPDFDRQEFWGENHRSDLSSSLSPLYSAMRTLPKQTLDWINSLSDEAERKQLLEDAISMSYNDDILRSIGELRPELRTLIAARETEFFGVDAEKMKEFANSLPAGPEREAAWMIIGQRIRDPIEMEPGPDRDAMLGAMVRARFDNGRDLEQRFELVQQISDPQKQRDAFDDLAFRIEEWAGND